MMLYYVPLLIMISSMVSAATFNNCGYFRITSPTEYFSTTAGQCRQISFDYAGPEPAPLVSVDLYESRTRKLINKLVQDIPANGTATPFFNMNLDGHLITSDYYFSINYGPGCDAIETKNFQIVFNPYSPPAICPTA